MNIRELSAALALATRLGLRVIRVTDGSPQNRDAEKGGSQESVRPAKSGQLPWNGNGGDRFSKDNKMEDHP